ncbi:unnamed protein product [Brassica rapa]|uniref:TRAF-type domain-containing protein n=2 Tax=Brassica campestris TaxID=3711 RepID=A0A3P5YYD6_BRACM|nr:unnamed protein product [Brassica rapa]VDC72827.1 unnamed protein product [Brassica rapa]
MDPPVSDPDKINNQKEAGPSFHCPLYDTQLVHKISLTFLPGLATACVDNTTGDIFKTPGSVAADVKQEMIEYLNHRSETFVADHILLSSSSEIEPSSHDPYDVVSDFVDDFATSKRNLFSRVSGWLLSERREDNIDDFAQEMEVSGFWLNDHIEGIAQTLLKNVDFKGLSHCEMKFQTQGELEEHVLTCGYRTMDCGNEGCNAVFCANQRESHDAVCPFKIIPCEQGCLESGGIMRREMDRHCITVCTMKLVNCAFRGVGCLDDVRQCEVQQHFLDSVGSHLMCVLKGMYKEASLDDLKPRAEEILQLSTRLSEARNARALTNLVKEIDAKLGALVIKPKKEKKALEEAEIKGKPETASEKIPEDKVVSKEAEVVVDDAMVEEVGKKVSEAEIGENVDKEGELKAQKLLEMDEFIKEGDDSSAADLSERTETKAPEVVVMDEDKEEEKSPETRTNETRGVETEAKDVIDEENHKEAKISAETKSEAPSTIVMDKEEGAETKQTRIIETKGVETKVNDMIDEENNRETKISAETKSEVPSRIAMENEEGAETKQTRTNESKGVETEVNDVIDEENKKETNVSAETKSESLMDKEENEEGAETKQTRTNETRGVETEANDVIGEENNRETKISDETKREAPSSIVMDKEENEKGAETINSSASASDEAEALSKSSEASGRVRVFVWLVASMELSISHSPCLRFSSSSPRFLAASSHHHHRPSLHSAGKLLSRPKDVGFTSLSSSCLRSKFVSTGYRKISIRACSQVGAAGSDPVLDRIARFQNACWRFLRPHTIRGTALGSTALVTRALIENTHLIKWSLVLKALSGLLALICGNGYIVGINQIYDIGIDKVNKPYLPIAAGDLSVQSAWLLVIFFAVAGLTVVGVNFGPFITCLYSLGLFLGTIYSVPPFRMKRFPVAAFLIIATVRGFLLNFGVYHATRAALGLSFQWSAPVAFITSFVTLFALVIAITKDLPDVEGDRKFQISTLATKLGVRNIAFLGSGLLLVNYISAISLAFYMPQVFRGSLMIPAHMILASCLIFQTWVLEKANYTKEAIAGYYRFIWNLFYAEYLLFPFF